uniref:Ras-related protein Rab-28 n=1 Tax=Caenorhabditis japonica TaxID=281687 RepID=A0A8R1DNF9_CAEJA
MQDSVTGDQWRSAAHSLKEEVKEKNKPKKTAIREKVVVIGPKMGIRSRAIFEFRAATIENWSEKFDWTSVEDVVVLAEWTKTASNNELMVKLVEAVAKEVTNVTVVPSRMTCTYDEVPAITEYRIKALKTAANVVLVNPLMLVGEKKAPLILSECKGGSIDRLVEFLEWVLPGHKIVERLSRDAEIVVVGDGASGKTSICQRFAKESFEKTYHQTLGLDFFSRRIMLPQELQVLVQVWDIGGQSIAGEMIDKYLTGADVVFLVYDVTNSKSFENAGDWLAVVKKNTKDNVSVSLERVYPVKLVLMGNKTDLEERRVVSVESHKAFATQNDLMSTYVSAKTGDTVFLTFRQAVAEVLNVGLSRAEVEADIEIVKGTVIEPVKPTEVQHVRRSDQSKSTSVCSIS